MTPPPPRTRGALTLIVAGALALLAAPTQAQSDEDLQQAKKRFKEGEKLYKSEDFEAAARSFTSAYELSKRAELLYYIGTSWEKAGRLIKARSAYERYIDELPDAPNADKILDKIIALQQRIAEEMGRVEVTTEPSGLPVFVGKEQRCDAAPCTITLPPGAHKLHTTTPEGQTVSASVELAAGATEAVALTLQITKTGRLLIETDAGGGRVRVGSVERELPLRAPLELEAGPHAVELWRGQTRWVGDVSVDANETTRLLVPLDASGPAGPNFKRLGAYTLWSAGAGLLVGGLLMGRQTRQTYTTLEDQRAGGQTIDARFIDQGRRQQRATNVLLIASGVAVAGGAGLFAWDMFGGRPGPPPSPSEGAESEDRPDEAPENPVELVE